MIFLCKFSLFSGLWNREAAAAISSKLSYYYSVPYLFGKLIQGMTLNDRELFQYDDYPLSQPDMTGTDFQNLTNWTYTGTPGIKDDQQQHYLNHMKALNYFSLPLLRSFEEISIASLSATFMDTDNTSLLTLGYPNSNFKSSKNNLYSESIRKS